MKRVNNLYEKITDLNVITDMYDNTVAKNTKNKSKIERFNDYYSANIIDIKNIIDKKSYISGKYNIFSIREPKLRIIMSQNIKDKVINHLVAKYFLVDIFDKCFIDSNVATRIGKGTHYGTKLTKKYLELMKKQSKTIYYLKFDISKYFYNIDHKIVKGLIRKKIKDSDVLNIIDGIIDSTDYEYVNKQINYLKKAEIIKIKNQNISETDKTIQINNVLDIPLYKNGKGLPIGNMASQIIAILYLNELDHFIKENLKIKYYIRYMDDGVLLHENKDYLNYCLKEIEKYLELLKLTLNKKKTRIDSIKNGIDFLGYRFYLKDNKAILKVRNNTKKRFKRKMNKLYKLYNNNLINFNRVRCVRDSYFGHLRYGNCNGLIYENLKNM